MEFEKIVFFLLTLIFLLFGLFLLLLTRPQDNNSIDYIAYANKNV